MRFILFIVALVFVPCLTLAAEYKPGSVGYLYQDCKKALAESDSLRAAHGTYCGAFAEGYFMGVLSTSGFKLPAPNEGDQCFADKQREYQRLNERFCPALPGYDPKQDKAGETVYSVVDTVMLWARVNKGRFHQPATRALGSLVQPGAFCEKLPAPAVEVEINPGLLDLRWRDILGAKSLVSHKGKYEQCKADIETAKGRRSAFKATRCGAEITGFIAGLYASDHVHEPKASSAAQCAKPIERLYNSINPAKTMCVKRTTDPLYVARVFVENYELIRGQRRLLASMDVFDHGALGAVGYETIYRGFLCRNEFERRAGR